MIMQMDRHAGGQAVGGGGGTLKEPESEEPERAPAHRLFHPQDH
ncbi:hypothetical protein AAH991_25385 [Microbispora sp. ZYX-F-249]|uniref:Uncharacterized protein n=1 Tax=Microbispora maris TaxID=3144104 RepID=A0ABV0AXP9_9ACTN